MSFNPAIPLSTASPSVFPAQNQTNMARLKTLMSADHQFNNSAASNDGYHTLIHMIPQAPTGALAGFGRLYVKSVSSVQQLHYMDDGGTEFQITPQYDISPMKVSGSQSMTTGSTLTIFDVAYDFTGFGYVFISGSNQERSYIFMRSSSNTKITNLDVNGSNPPSMSFSGTKLQAKNNASGTETIVWSLMINRL